MMPHREDMVFIKGLFNKSAFVSTSPHLGRMNLLSGAPISLDPNEIRAGVTMDQVLASAIGDRTAIPSLVLGIEPNELRLEDGLSMIYGSSLSWISPTRPATKEIYPARTFARLVGDGTGRALDRSILDAVRQEAQGLKPRISRDDHHKLGEYFEGIRDIEQRIARAAKDTEGVAKVGKKVQGVQEFQGFKGSRGAGGARGSPVHQHHSFRRRQGAVTAESSGVSIRGGAASRAPTVRIRHGRLPRPDTVARAL
jgi:hypothetical protein